MLNIHVSYGVTDDCKNLEESYGEICVKCNKCGRFDKDGTESEADNGKTIDKTIEFFNGLECHTPQAKDAREVAIDTMRKYQKIQQIVRETPNDDWIGRKIKKVLEDGRT